LNSRLLALNSSQGLNREEGEKDAGKQNQEDVIDSRDGYDLGAGMSLRERKHQAMKAKEVSESANARIIPVNPTKVFTAKSLFGAIFAILTGVGTVWTWIYVNVHGFFLIVFGPNIICRFGEEWVLGSPGGSALSAVAGSERAQAEREAKIKRIGFIEILALIFVNFIVFSVLMILFVIVVSFVLWKKILIIAAWEWAKNLFGV
jgi:hypothetical protein